MLDGKVVLLFAGQGAFDDVALRAARQMYSEIDQVFRAIDHVTREVTGRELSDIVFGQHSTLDDLLRDDPWVSQLAIFGSGVAAYRILCSRGLRPDVLMGHSLGEISALVSANMLSVEDGAHVVLHRTQAVQEAQPDGYLAALATSAIRTQQIVSLIDDPELAVAAENHDNQTILGGPTGALDTARAIARELGIGTTRLGSPFPFHSPVLRSAVPRFVDRIRGLVQRPAEVPVYSPILSRYYESNEPLPELLAEHLVRPVTFAQALRQVHADGGRVFVEAGGLAALSKLCDTVLPADSRAYPTLAVDRAGDLAITRTLNTLLPNSSVDGLAALLAPGTDPGTFAEFWAAHGREIVVLTGERLRDFVASQTAPPVPPEPPDAPEVDREALAAEIRSIYANALEYPEEVFDDDVLLEAELGVDSVKRVELMGRVAEGHGIATATEGLRMSDYDTIGKIVDFVHGALRGRNSDRLVAVSG